MPGKGSNKQRYNFLIDKSTYDDFSLLCEELGLVRSKNLERYMKEFIEENQDTLEEIKKRDNK